MTAPAIASVTVDVDHLDERLRDGRSFEWWRQFTPGWLDVVINDNGSVTFTPNGKHADGSQTTPSSRMYGAMLRWIENSPAFADGVMGGAR